MHGILAPGRSWDVDVSARHVVPKETLTFSVPMNKFIRMAENMKESYLATRSWDKVKKEWAEKSAE